MSPGNGDGVADRGHRALPHTADVLLEAWGPDLAACCEEAVGAVVDTYAVVPGRLDDVASIGAHDAHVGPATDEDVLLAVLDELVFALDTSTGVPVSARVVIARDGGIDVRFRLVPRAVVEGTGAVPKAVSRSELSVVRGHDGVRCRFLIDV